MGRPRGIIIHDGLNCMEAVKKLYKKLRVGRYYKIKIKCKTGSKVKTGRVIYKNKSFICLKTKDYIESFSIFSLLSEIKISELN